MKRRFREQIAQKRLSRFGFVTNLNRTALCEMKNAISIQGHNSIQKMLDLHNHILPGIDDGAADFDESVRMAKIMVAEGFRAVVATPHYGRAGFYSEHATVRRLVRELKVELCRQQINLVVYPGMEVLLSPEIPELLRNRKVFTLNDSPYILIEFPQMGLPAGLDNFISQLLSDGKKLIIAHPEKNHEIQRRLDHFVDLVNSFRLGDILIQITADSLTNKAGHKAFLAAKFLLRTGLAHIISTDAHSCSERPPNIREALTIAMAIAGRERTMKMVRDWPETIVSGGEVIPERPDIKVLRQSLTEFSCSFRKCV